MLPVPPQVVTEWGTILQGTNGATGISLLGLRPITLHPAFLLPDVPRAMLVPDKQREGDTELH